MTQSGTRTLLWMVAPALLIAIVFHIALGHRSDYLGHYAAGYGGTIAGMMFLLAVLERVSAVIPIAVLMACLASVLFGALLEAPIFRIGRFDEVDFCNQSLGAVLAALVTIAVSARRVKFPTSMLAGGVAIGFLFLVGGFWFAFS